MTMVTAVAPTLHWLALALAAAAAVAGVRRSRGRARAVTAATGAVMVAAMADTAAGSALLAPPAWTAILLAGGIAAAWAGRRREPAATAAVAQDAAGEDRAAPHLLHVTCLPVMAALTATMAHHSPTAAPGADAHHGDVLTVVALLAAAVHVAAGLALTVRSRPPGTRAESLAGAGAVAAMAGAAVL